MSARAVNCSVFVCRNLKHVFRLTGSTESYGRGGRRFCIRQRRWVSSSASTRDYESTFAESVEKAEDFWAAAAEKIDWFQKWERVLDQDNLPFTRWFVGGKLNTCYNAVDRHVLAGKGHEVAIIYDSPVTSTVRRITYAELLQLVQDFAGALVAQGVKAKDRVLIYMPMIPEAIVAMLASARIGAVHSLVFGGFASKELSVRIAHCEPTVVVSANCGLEPSRTVHYKPLLDAALDMMDYKPHKCIIYNRPQFEAAPLRKGQDMDWNDAVAQGRPAQCVPVAATDPVYILYTSGTTGQPKAVVRPNGGHAVAMSWSMQNIYNMEPGEVWWAASDLGWVVGHSYITYGPLINGSTTVLYEGKPVGTPNPGSFFRVLKEHQVKSLFVAPTALRAIRAEDSEGMYAKSYLPLDKFGNLFVAGEHCDHETMLWIRGLINKPVLDHWWQTETGWAITGTCTRLRMDLYPEPGTTGKPVPGWNVQVLNPDGQSTKPGELGQIFVKQPLPPGFMSTLYQADQQFRDIYFKTLPGYYDTMDCGVKDKKGYISVLSRSDDVINVAGHRLSCGTIEEEILECPDVVEAAVVGVPDKLKGSVPLGLCVLRHDCQKSEEQIKSEVIQCVRNGIGPVAAFRLVVIVSKLPKTRSGKVARNTLAALAAGKPFKIPATIEDANVYVDIEARLKAIGYAKKS